MPSSRCQYQGVPLISTHHHYVSGGPLLGHLRNSSGGPWACCNKCHACLTPSFHHAHTRSRSHALTCSLWIICSISSGVMVSRLGGWLWKPPPTGAPPAPAPCCSGRPLPTAPPTPPPPAARNCCSVRGGPPGSGLGYIWLLRRRDAPAGTTTLLRR